MKKETLKEIGKGAINLANLIGGLSVVNGFFGKEPTLPKEFIAIIILYIFVILYSAGIIFINKGSDDD
jgi:hypothetical protein